jgi:NAD(P)-dependent dehydrogenase (short-subunit alcohol dehydrogenase family)
MIFTQEGAIVAAGLFDLTGKVAVVTGGNGGLGLGFATGIAKQGGSVAIWARNAEKNAAAKAELEQYGVKVSTRLVDVASEQEVKDAFAAVLEEFGRVDTVVANSGITGTPSASVLDMPTEDFHALLAINQHGAFYTLREGARHMVDRAKAGEPGGSLIFCGSLSMFVGLQGMANYAAAKGAMGAIVRSFAVEFGKYGIRANSIAPGYIKTLMSGGADTSAVDAWMSERTPIPRPGYPADFEAIAAYLASDASSFHTGDTIVIDGGYLVNL